MSDRALAWIVGWRMDRPRARETFSNFGDNECSRFFGLKYTESRRLRSDLQSHAVGLFVHDVIFCMSAHVLPCLLFDRRSHVICFCNVMHVLLHSRSSVKEKEERCSTISFVGRLNDGIGAETYSVRALL